MTLIINNQEVQQLLTMEDTFGALEQGYLQLAAGEAVCRPRIDIRIPTSDPARNYQLPGRVYGSWIGGAWPSWQLAEVKAERSRVVARGEDR